MKKICSCDGEKSKCSNCPCECEYCKGEFFLQVDPVGCGCTECQVGEYRPAVDEEDYKKHNS